jgi:hypothetical protein
MPSATRFGQAAVGQNPQAPVPSVINEMRLVGYRLLSVPKLFEKWCKSCSKNGAKVVRKMAPKLFEKCSQSFSKNAAKVVRKMAPKLFEKWRQSCSKNGAKVVRKMPPKLFEKCRRQFQKLVMHPHRIEIQNLVAKNKKVPKV